MFTRHKTILLRFETWFIGLAALYWFFAFLGFSAMSCMGPCNPPALYPGGVWWENLIGIFVPITPNSLVVFVFNLSTGAIGIVLALALIIGTLVFGDSYLRKLNLSPAKKISVNLGALLVLTSVVDIATTFHLSSIYLLLNSLGLVKIFTILGQ